MKLVIEIDLDKVRHDSYDGKLDRRAVAALVESAAERLRDLDMTEDMLGCSYRLKDDNDRTVGSVTIQGDGNG